jgi:cell division protein FtsQ
MSNAAAIRAERMGAAGNNPPRARRISRLTRICLAALMTAVALFFLARFAVLPLLTIRHVLLQGDSPLSREETLRIAGLRTVEYWHSVPCAAIQKRLEADPLVRRARVERIFPATVRMTVDRRLPVALVLAESGGRSVPLLVDGEGYLCKVAATGAEIDLPVVSGISAGELRLGAGLPRAYAALFAELAALRDSSPSLAALLSEVRVAQAGTAGLDLVLYLTPSPVPVRVRGPIDRTLMTYTLMVLDLLSKQGVLNDIQELDFRGGQVVYRMKEG